MIASEENGTVARAISRDMDLRLKSHNWSCLEAPGKLLIPWCISLFRVRNEMKDDVWVARATGAQVIIKVSGHQYQSLEGGYNLEIGQF